MGLGDGTGFDPFLTVVVSSGIECEITIDSFVEGLLPIVGADLILLRGNLLLGPDDLFKVGYKQKIKTELLHLSTLNPY